jgi:phage-related tail protein
MTEVRQLNQVERGVEEVLRNFAGKEANVSNAAGDRAVNERIERIGNISGLAIIDASEMTAKDIEQAAQAAVDIAADIMKQAQQLGTELRATGKKIGEHLKEFATVANKVSTVMRNTRAEVLDQSRATERAITAWPGHHSEP